MSDESLTFGLQVSSCNNVRHRVPGDRSSAAERKLLSSTLLKVVEWYKHNRTEEECIMCPQTQETADLVIYISVIVGIDQKIVHNSFYCIKCMPAVR